MKLPVFILCLSLGGRVGLAQGLDATSNIRFQPGFQFIANQYKADDNRVSRLILQPFEGTQFYKLNNGVFSTNMVRSGVWTNPDERLAPGEGAIVFNPSTNVFTRTFAGQILQGNLINTIPAGLSLKSAMLPEAGEITSALELGLSPFDNVYLWKTNRLEVYTLLPDRSWFPSEPTLRLSEAFFVRANRQTNWVKVFKFFP